MLKKSANPISCLMYEMGSNGRLIAMPLQGGRASDEYVDAMVLEQAAYLTDDCPMCEAGQVSEATHSLKQLDRPWLKADSLTPQKLRQLEHLRMELEKTAGDRTQQPPFSTVPLDHRTMLRLPVVANIDVKKSDRDKSGAKVETCKPVCLDRFEVTAGFDTMSRKFVDRRQQSLVDPAQMQFMMDESDEFAKKAFPAMPVFSGCALQPLITGTTLVQVGKNRASVHQALSKVLENTHKQCALARELKESQEQALVLDIRSTLGQEAALNHSDRELLDHAIIRFERGELPRGLKEARSLCQKMAALMLTEIDLQTARTVAWQLGDWQRSFTHFCNNAVFIEQTPEEYSSRCRELNLRLATITQRQQQAQKRIQSYSKQPLNEDTRALLSFERRRKIVLSDDQAFELLRGFGVIRRWAAGEKVALVSHKGTGYGKSTNTLALADNAAGKAGTSLDKNVLVMAPPSNQAELDVMFDSYFDSKGLCYRRLDMKSLSQRFGAPITVKHLTVIENTLMGLPEDTPESDRQKMLEHGKAPVGASIADIQALMFIKQDLSSEDCETPDKANLLIKMDQILDLLRKYMILADEWDSSMVPHTPEQLSGVSMSVNQILRNMDIKVQVTPQALICSHSEFLFGANRHGLSATMGTDLAAAMLTGSTSMKEVKALAGTDVLTTNGRFMHLVSQAQLVVFDSDEDQDQEELMRHLVRRTGGDVPMVMFNGQDDGTDRTEAERRSAVINEERRKLHKPVKGVLYYNDDKKLCLQKDGDPVYHKGAQLQGDLEKQLRMTGSWDADSYLAKPESVGTDAPQGQQSVGVVMGVVKQAGSDARQDLLTQQVGRVIRASKNLHKPQKLVLVVDQKEIRQLPNSPEKAAFTEANSRLKAAREALEAELGVPVEQTAGDLKKQIFAPVNVPLPKPKKGETMEEALPRAIDAELKRIQKEDWTTLSLKAQAKQALIAMKTAQCELQQCWMTLLATEMAERQVSQETMDYEKQIEQARVNAYLNEAYSDQDEWLQGAAVSTVDSSPLKTELLKPESLQQVAPVLKADCISEIQKISRRQHDGSVNAADLTEAASLNELQERWTHIFPDSMNMACNWPPVTYCKMFG